MTDNLALSTLSTPAAISQFIRGGRSIITVQSAKSGNHFTYRIARKSDDQPFFVSLLSGPDNEADYTYVGVLDTDRVRVTKKSTMTCDSTPVKALSYVLKHVAAGQMPPEAIVHHEGRCAVCARTLTTPESVTRGIGPECWAKMGG